MCVRYLMSNHKEIIQEILASEDDSKHFSINIVFVELFQDDPDLAQTLLQEPEKSLKEWDLTILKVQNDLINTIDDKNYTFKKNVHCRIHDLPHRTIFPKIGDKNELLQITGTVVRMTAAKMLESCRQYLCVKCKHPVVMHAEFDKNNVITPPKKCTNPEGCSSTNLIRMGELDAENCKDYQEIKLQEVVSHLEAGSIPNSMWVALDDDLVDSCKPGDSITVCGIVKQRWSQLRAGQKLEIQLVIKAIHIQIINSNGVALVASVNAEATAMFRGFWETYADQALAARDIILKSICPQLFGLHLVKLAVAVVLAGGSQTQDTTAGIRIRSEPHLLLIGDPGTGKSQLLRFASKLIARSVLTTGIGSTAAGLTAAAVMENGEWQLEGGALVLSDGGICCIDEFNSMKEHDRISIHEAMEQQTISVAKVIQTNSKAVEKLLSCDVAATNPKGGNLDPSQPLGININFASPLLSRFDLIMLLKDNVNSEVDSLLTDYILNRQDSTNDVTTNISWTVETLQSYFAIIKKFHPKLTDDSTRILSGYYQAQRQKNCRNKSRTTVRLLDSLIRLSQGHARLMYHTQVWIMDAVIAVALVETAMNEEFSYFNLQFDVQSHFPLSPMQNYKELVEVILKKLNLHDILEKEMIHLNATIKFDRSELAARPQKDELKKSKFFQVVETNNLSGEASSSTTVEELVEKQEENANEEKSNKRGKNQHQRQLKKKKKPNDHRTDIADDLEALNHIPSINDDFQLDSNALEYEEIENLPKPNEFRVKQTKDEKDEERSTKSAKRREFLSKFRFKPSEKVIQKPTVITAPVSHSQSIFNDDNEDFDLDL